MPVKRGSDSKGPYYRWGAAGKKYHYKAGSASSRERAREEAAAQGRAVSASKARRAKRGGVEASKRKSTHPDGAWIKRKGKLGGKGYLEKPAAVRHALLDKCVSKYGYKSCLDSVLVLNRNHEIKALHGKEIRADANYLEKKHGKLVSSLTAAQKHSMAERKTRPNGYISERKKKTATAKKKTAATAAKKKTATAAKKKTTSAAKKKTAATAAKKKTATAAKKKTATAAKKK